MAHCSSPISFEELQLGKTPFTTSNVDTISKQLRIVKMKYLLFFLVQTWRHYISFSIAITSQNFQLPLQLQKVICNELQLQFQLQFLCFKKNSLTKSVTIIRTTKRENITYP